MHLKNRILLAPLTRGRAGAERIPNSLMAEYYEQRAGAGLLITEATSISEEGIGWIDNPGIYSNAMVEGWRQATTKTQQQETPFVLQMWHCGRASHSDFHHGNLPLSASDVKLNGDEIHTPKGKKSYETPKAMTSDDIQRTVDDYKQAAINALEAGFSGVEIHAANGYLINQFLDSRSNQRTDNYGGSLDNRFRFLQEVVEAVTSIIPAKNVGVRLSPNGVFNDMGAEDFRETFLFVAERLNNYKIGYAHIMDGLAFGFHEKGEPMTLAEFREVYEGVIIGNCGYTLETAKTAVEQGVADAIAFGRPFISNPDLVERFKHGYELAPFDDMAHWYTSGEEGYTDYSVYQS